MFLLHSTSYSAAHTAAWSRCKTRVEDKQRRPSTCDRASSVASVGPEARVRAASARRAITTGMGLKHLSLSALEPELQVLVYVLIAIHLLVLVSRTPSASAPYTPH